MAESRYVGGYPVIGIRPCIDGRRGPIKMIPFLLTFDFPYSGINKVLLTLFMSPLLYSDR